MLRAILIALVLTLSATPISAGTEDIWLEAFWARVFGNYEKAERLFRILAEQGVKTAQYQLGEMYLDGEGVPQDASEAAKWFLRAAKQGDFAAQNAIGLLYHDGNGVPQDYAEAMRWYRKAAEQGSAAAQTNLGAMYAKGDGVSQDATEAAKWFRKGAKQGNPTAQTNLGTSYRYGEGVVQDYVLAYMWYSIAIANEPAKVKTKDTAREFRSQIETKMTVEQIAEAQRICELIETVQNFFYAKDEREDAEELLFRELADHDHGLTREDFGN